MELLKVEQGRSELILLYVNDCYHSSPLHLIAQYGKTAAHYAAQKSGADSEQLYAQLLEYCPQVAWGVDNVSFSL